MSHDFIIIRKRILDYKIYKREFQDLSCYLTSEMLELMHSAGFNSGVIESMGYSMHKLAFYNSEMDMEIRVSIKKREKEAFI